MADLTLKKGQRYSTILNNIHKSIIDDTWILDAKNQQDQAKEKTKLLKKIKEDILNITPTSSPTVNMIQDNLQDIVNNTYQNVSNLMNGTNQKLFNTKKMGDLTKDIFEQELGYLIKAAGEAKGISIDINLMLIGAKGATSRSLLNFNLKKFEKELEKQTVENAVTQYRKKIEDIKSKSNSPVIRSGKIDLDGTHINYEGDTSTIAGQILKVFSGGTFSIKNYQLVKDFRLDLGDTNFYKSITSPLSTIFSNQEDIDTVYYRGMNYLNKHTRQPDTSNYNFVAQHFAHLRFMYELRGLGLIDVNNPNLMREADFLLYNNPDGPEVVIHSTKAIILKALERQRNPFQPITLNKGLVLG